MKWAVVLDSAVRAAALTEPVAQAALAVMLMEGQLLVLTHLVVRAVKPVTVAQAAKTRDKAAPVAIVLELQEETDSVVLVARAWEAQAAPQSAMAVQAVVPMVTEAQRVTVVMLMEDQLSAAVVKFKES
jgi:hypothetical protein